MEGWRSARSLAALAAFVTVGSIACAIPDRFPCDATSRCVRDGVGGHCEPTGWCSFDDESCVSRRRYAADVSGEVSNQCVPETVPRWIRSIGGPDDDRVSAMTLEGGDHPIVVGSFRGETVGDVFASRGDADVLIVAFDGATGTTLWSLDGGGPGRDELGGVSFANGVLSVGGSARGGLELGERQVSSAGAGSNAFIARLTPSESRATVDFLHLSSGGGDEHVVASAGGAWVGGYLGGEVAFSPGDTHAPRGALDVWAGFWAATENPDPIWSDVWGSAGVDRVTGAALSLNQLVVVGAFVGNLPVTIGEDSQPRLVTLGSAGGTDGFVLTLRASGAPNGRAVVLAAERLGGSADDVIQAVLLSEGNGRVLAGTFARTVDFAGNAVTARGESDAFVFWPDGARVWQAGGEGGAASACCIAGATNGDILIAGTFDGVIHAGEHVLQSRGQTDVFVARIAPDGRVVWADRFGGPGMDAAVGVEISAGDDVFVAAAFAETASIGGIPVSSAGASDWAVFSLRRR